MTQPNPSFASLALLAVVCAAAGAADVVRFQVRPGEGFRRSSVATPRAFFQAVPMKQGAWEPGKGDLALFRAGRAMPGRVSVSTWWPDGSAQWVAVEGFWTGPAPKAERLEARVASKAAAARPPFTVGRSEKGVVILDAGGRTFAELQPTASMLRIARPKVTGEQNPDYWDKVSQYHWAEPMEALSKNPRPFPLAMRVRDFKVERANAFYAVYRVRGDGGADGPGAGLEWQLRVRVYAPEKRIGFQMTWAAHWDTEKYALADARWTARFGRSFDQASVAGQSLPLGKGSVVVRSSARGRSELLHAGARRKQWDAPDAQAEALVLRPSGQEAFLAVALPDASKLGPNRVLATTRKLDLANWSGWSGKALDFRKTVGKNEFGVGKPDWSTSARGFARTCQMEWAWADDAASARAVALGNSRRDGLWMPTRRDLTATGALGPWRDGTYENNRTFFEAVRANLRFVGSSRRRWRWYGFVNYGDVRTNFGRGRAAKRGIFPRRWSLYGRYGWRNGAAQAYLGFLLGGLFLEDREIALDALAYARHVADVDMIHGSFFRKPLRNSGAIHRRNRNHWSGVANQQYSPTQGLYLARWLTGHDRLADSLAEARGYAARGAANPDHPFGNNSAFAGAAWICRYRETHDPKDLAMAESRLNDCANFWGKYKKDCPLKGLAAMYFHNFRHAFDGYPSLILFHKATGDRRYLDAMVKSLRAHRVKHPSPHLMSYAAAAYLLANGYGEPDLGEGVAARYREHVRALTPGQLPPVEKWNYETLVNISLTKLPPFGSATYRETTNIGWRASAAPLALTFFGEPNAPTGPRPGR